MKIIFLTINVFLISFISCSYYSKTIERKHLNQSKQCNFCSNKTNLIQEKSSETTNNSKDNSTLSKLETEKLSILKDIGS